MRGVHLIDPRDADTATSHPAASVASRAPTVPAGAGAAPAPAPAPVTVVSRSKHAQNRGSWVAGADGSSGPFHLVRLRWDNSHSWVTSKVLCRRIDVILAGDDPATDGRCPPSQQELLARARAAHLAAFGNAPVLTLTDPHPSDLPTL